jgi:hypothetical protein
MTRPPNRYRRRKLQRRVALGIAALMALIAAGAYSYWQDTRFPAHSARVAGLPVELRVQDGVTTVELGVIRRGLRLTDRFMRRALGRTVTGHVEARIARSNGCRPFQKAGEAIVGEAERGFLCIDTASPAWQWLMLKDRLAASAAAGHEYVHVLQGELGCLQSPLNERFRWLMEGMAEEVSWRALVAGHRTTEKQVERQIRSDGALDPNLEPLQRYEFDGGRDPEYALWQLAVRRLFRAAVASGVAPARRPELALRRFCVRVGARRPWRRAFETSFGISLERFYAGFEIWRRADVVQFGSTAR